MAYTTEEYRLVHEYELSDKGKDFSKQYLTIVSLGDGNYITWQHGTSSLIRTISVSLDNGQTWTTVESTEQGAFLGNLEKDQKMLIKGNNTSYGSNLSGLYVKFNCTKDINIEGNIMSLIYGDDFVGQTILDSNGYTFANLFKECTNLISAENLILPATTLATNCYY